MRHEVKKISRIVDELTTMLLKDDTNEVDFKIKMDLKQTVITIVDYHSRCDEKKIERLRESLSIQRQHEMEEYYWQLAGESDCDDELTLVGAMIDEATIELKDGNLHIQLIRYRE